MQTLGYLLIRIILWGAGVLIAALPTLAALPGDLPPLFMVGSAINNAGLFRDLFFVVVPASVLALSTVIEFLITHYSNAKGEAQTACIVCLLLNVIALASGLVGFLELPAGPHILSPRPFAVYGWLILFAIGFSLLTEVGISWASYRHHRGQPTTVPFH